MSYFHEEADKSSISMKTLLLSLLCNNYISRLENWATVMTVWDWNLWLTLNETFFSIFRIRILFWVETGVTYVAEHPAAIGLHEQALMYGLNARIPDFDSTWLKVGARYIHTCVKMVLPFPFSALYGPLLELIKRHCTISARRSLQQN
jgi:hypothetical protein